MIIEGEGGRSGVKFSKKKKIIIAMDMNKRWARDLEDSQQVLKKWVTTFWQAATVILGHTHNFGPGSKEKQQ